MATKGTKGTKSSESSQGGGENAVKGKILLIGVDKTVKEVVELDRMGAHLQFDVDGFPELSEKEIRGLSKNNKDVYLIALQALRIGEHARKVNREVNKGEAPMYRQLRVLGGSASNRLKAPKDLRPGLHWAPKRPDEVDEAVEQGYVKMGQLTSIDGKTEMVGMAISEERYQEHLAAVGELSQRRANSHREHAVERLTTGESKGTDQTTVSRAVLPEKL